MLIGKHFQPGKWTKIYNFWGTYRTLRKGVVPSIFPFPTRKSTPGRKLVRVGHNEFSEEECQDEESHDEDNIDDVVLNSESEQNPAELLAQLEAAKDEIARLKQLLGEAKLEIVELKKGVTRKRFGIEAVRDSDKDVNFYTDLPNAAVLTDYWST